MRQIICAIGLVLSAQAMAANCGPYQVEILNNNPEDVRVTGPGVNATYSSEEQTIIYTKNDQREAGPSFVKVMIGESDRGDLVENLVINRAVLTCQ